MMHDPFEMLAPQIARLATSAAATARWVHHSVAAVPELEGIGLTVTSARHVEITRAGIPLGVAVLSDDSMGFAVIGPNDVEVAPSVETLPVAIFRLTAWHAANPAPAPELEPAPEPPTETEPS